MSIFESSLRIGDIALINRGKSRENEGDQRKPNDSNAYQRSFAVPNSNYVASKDNFMLDYSFAIPLPHFKLSEITITLVFRKKTRLKIIANIYAVSLDRLFGY